LIPQVNEGQNLSWTYHYERGKTGPDQSICTQTATQMCAFESCVGFEVHVVFKIQDQKHPYPYQDSFEIKEEDYLVVGVVVGHPKAGKSHFCNELTWKFGNEHGRVFPEGQATNTVLLRRAEIKRDGKPTLVILDTRGITFDLRKDDDKLLLHALKKGLKEGTNLADRDQWNSDAYFEPKNRISRFVVVTAAYLIEGLPVYAGLPGFRSASYPETPPPVGLKPLCDFVKNELHQGQEPMLAVSFMDKVHTSRYEIQKRLELATGVFQSNIFVFGVQCHQDDRLTCSNACRDHDHHVGPQGNVARAGCKFFDRDCLKVKNQQCDHRWDDQSIRDAEQLIASL